MRAGVDVFVDFVRYGEYIESSLIGFFAAESIDLEKDSDDAIRRIRYTIAFAGAGITVTW